MNYNRETTDHLQYDPTINGLLEDGVRFREMLRAVSSLARMAIVYSRGQWHTMDWDTKEKKSYPIFADAFRALWEKGHTQVTTHEPD